MYAADWMFHRTQLWINASANPVRGFDPNTDIAVS